MTTATEQLPITDVIEPDDVDQVAEVVKQAGDEQTAVYPIGGGTSLDYGLPARREGLGLALAKLNHVVDYPARDMTITVGAGITVAKLQETLAGESQRLPLDVPFASQATVGGLIATNSNGPRRYGCGTVRDYVIGIRAVDGRGERFSGGGRVVKNVAGYDFCKLLTGSLGTLGVITEVTLRLKPIPRDSVLVCCMPRDLDHAEELLAALVKSETIPVAVELLLGSDWDDTPLGPSETPGGWLVVGVEGTEAEVEWMTKQLAAEWSRHGVDSPKQLRGEPANSLWQRLIEFPATGDSPLVLKISVLPSATTDIIQTLRQNDTDVSLQAHAGSGVVVARFAEFPPDGLSRTLVGQLEPAASRGQGSVTILSNPSGAEMTHHSMWGATDVPFWLMKKVKQAFDPQDILNPGRFVY